MGLEQYTLEELQAEIKRRKHEGMSAADEKIYLKITLCD